MLNTLGIVLAADNNPKFGVLTEPRAVAALPVAGRYRIIDFILSSMANSGVSNVGIITLYNYQSLLDHIGSGKAYDLARKNEGLVILPPFRDSNSQSGITKSKIDLIYGALHFIKSSKKDYVIVADSDNICNIDFNEALEQHKQTEADVTVIYTNRDERFGNRTMFVDVNNKKVVDIEVAPESTIRSRSIGYYIFNREVLVEVLEKAYAKGKKDFKIDIFVQKVNELKIYGYEFKGYIKKLIDVDAYYNFNMDLLNMDVHIELLEGEKRVYTKIKDKTPCRYFKNAEINNSIIADGCEIDGTIENSIIFRGVKVAKGAVIKNSIVMQNSKIKENAKLDCVICDKASIISEGKEIKGTDTLQVVVGKHQEV